MNVINNNLAKSLMVIGAFSLFIIAFIFGVTGMFAYFGFYTFPATLAIISFSTSGILAIRQKRISIIFIATLITGFLFLTSSIIEFGFGIFTQNMSIRDQIEFYGIMRPSQVSHGLASFGAGIIFVLVSFKNIKSKSLLNGSNLSQMYKIFNVVQLGVGVFLLLFGIYIFITGFQPL